MALSPPLFAIGDIHGCSHELEQLLDQLPLTPQSTVVFLGDYIDRGPNSRGVIEQILSLKERCHVVTLAGNHETMLLEFLNSPNSKLAGYFVFNGGSATLASYVTEGNNYLIPDDHLGFFKSLKPCHQTETHFFVHAGVPNKPLSSIEISLENEDLLWIRQPFLSSDYDWGRIIVHGHSPRQEVEILKNRINLDTACVYGGKLTAMEVHTQTLYQVEARKDIPRTFLKETPGLSRAAKRFVGSLPVHTETRFGAKIFETLNYNEFGLLIYDQESEFLVFEVGEHLQGEIFVDPERKIPFVGVVVRYQTRGSSYAYGVKIHRMDHK